MIDLHSHILPNIDDGSKNIEETNKMLKEAKKAGFTGIISTSHYIEGTYELTKGEREEYIQNIQNNLKENNIKIYNGSETYITENIVKLINEGKIATINNTRYVLIELPMNNKIFYLDDIIYDLLSAKFIPIIAHPERYTYVQKEPNFLIEYIEKGVLFQANYGSVIGKYGKEAKKTVEKLLKNNMISFLGSDVHRSNSIYTQMDSILKKIEKIVGKEKLYMLTTGNAEKVIKDIEIEVLEPTKVKRKLFEKR